MERNRVDEVNLFSGASKEDKRVQDEREKDERESDAAASAFKALQDRDIALANRKLAASEHHAEKERLSLEKHAEPQQQQTTTHSNENASSLLSIELAGACQRGEQDLKQSNSFSKSSGWNRSGPSLEGRSHNASLDNGLGMSLELPGPGK